MTIRVNVVDSRDSGHNPRSEILEMKGVPRVGDQFAWDPDRASFTVRSVTWLANGDDLNADVIVRGW